MTSERTPRTPDDVSGHVTRRILIVTDDSCVAQGIEYLLSESGHEVLVGVEHAGVVEQALTFRPEAALIDVDLGKGNPTGYEIARWLRAALGSAPFLIVYTGYDLARVDAEARAAGFDALLQKPSDPDEMLRLVSLSGRIGPLWEDTPRG